MATSAASTMMTATYTYETATNNSSEPEIFMLLFIASAVVNVIFLLLCLICIIKHCFGRETPFQFTGDDATKHYVPRSLNREWQRNRGGLFPSVGSLRRLPTESSFQPKSRIPQNPLPAIPLEDQNQLSVTINPLNTPIPEDNELPPSGPPPPVPVSKRPGMRRKRSLISRFSRRFSETEPASIYIDVDQKASHLKKHVETSSLEKSLIDDHLRKAMLPHSPACTAQETQHMSSSAYLTAAPMGENRLGVTAEPMKTFAIRKAV